MWKLVLLLSTFVVAQATVEDILGTWSITALSPPISEKGTCGQLIFDKAPGDADCTCDDGKKATLLSIAHAGQPETAENKIPVISVAGPNTASLNVKCTCGKVDYFERLATRLINDNYLLLYVVGRDKTEEPNKVVYAKQLQSSSEVDAVIATIEDLKNKTVQKVCTA